MPARIQAARQTGETFERAQRFSAEQRQRDSFNVHSGEGEYDVVIHFNARLADYVREKKRHDSQQLRQLKNGGVELRMKLPSLVEIERWVLSQGGDAIVVKPCELAEAVSTLGKEDFRSR